MEISDNAKKLLKNLVLYNNGKDNKSICTKKEMREDAYDDYKHGKTIEANQMNACLAKLTRAEERKEQISKWVDNILSEDFFCINLIETLEAAEENIFDEIDYPIIN